MKSKKESAPKNGPDSTRAEDLIHTMNCARWMVGEFRKLHFSSIANIFQRAVDDADAWIQTKAADGMLPRDTINTPIIEREIYALRSILMKYALINDPVIRQQLLNEMQQPIENEVRGSRRRKK